MSIRNYTLGGKDISELDAIKADLPELEANQIYMWHVTTPAGDILTMTDDLDKAWEYASRGPDNRVIKSSILTVEKMR